MLGLPKTGKTTYLAALWHVLKSSEVPGSLVLEHREGDQEYLNLIADQWSRCAELDRTPRAGQMEVAIVLRDPATGARVRMSIPDMSGEIYASQWEDRSCSTEFAELAANAGGCLAFIHPGTLVPTAWIAGGNSVYDGWVEGEEEEPAQEAVEPPPSTPWSAKGAPSQVQMVEVLQFLAELARRRLRLAFVVSAWDLVTENISPAGWVEKHLPLLWQYLRTNHEQFEVVYMGVSAQGGKTEDAGTVLEHAVASQRIRLVAPDVEGNDITHPIRWLMSPAQ
jgi:hypothetical protein